MAKPKSAILDTVLRLLRHIPQAINTENSTPQQLAKHINEFGRILHVIVKYLEETEGGK